MHTWISEAMLKAMEEQQRAIEDILLWGVHCTRDTRTPIRKILDAVKNILKDS